MVNTNLRMASFRIDSNKWADFMEYARENNTTATSLILNYIDGCLSQSNNGVMTGINRNDSIKNSDNSINCLKDVQDELIQENQKHDRNIDKLFELVGSLANENKALKSRLEDLEKAVEKDAQSLYDYKQSSDETITENVKIIDKLNELLAMTRTQLNECRIDAMTRQQLRNLLAQRGIKTSKDITKSDLLELVLENDIKVI